MVIAEVIWHTKAAEPFAKKVIQQEMLRQITSLCFTTSSIAKKYYGCGVNFANLLVTDLEEYLNTNLLVI